MNTSPSSEDKTKSMIRIPDGARIQVVTEENLAAWALEYAKTPECQAEVEAWIDRILSEGR